MRAKYSMYNSAVNIINLFATTIMSFIARTIFIKLLGQELLGIDGLFTNILSMLSLAELGVGVAINFSLYEPLAKKNIDKINALMRFYKIIYRYIGIFIIVIGISLMPFLHLLLKNMDINNIYIIYILYLMNTALSYFTSYKVALINADQQAYKLGFINFIFTFVVYGLQILILIKTRDFLLYLIILVIVRQIERFILNLYINKKYNYVDFHSRKKLNSTEIGAIKKNINGMMFHKLGNFFLNGIDNILIAAFVSIQAVGIYSNYLVIISVARNLITTTMGSMVSSFGNLIVMESEEIQEQVSKISEFFTFVIYGYITICFLNLLNPFVELWIGEKYLVDNISLIIICANFYLYCMLLPLDTVKTAAGTYNVDKYIPIVQVLVNLMFSYFLSKYFGLMGILLGTTLSYILVTNWNRPYIVYKHIFKMSTKKYYFRQLKNFAIIIGVYEITKVLLLKMNFELTLMNLFLEGVICTIIYFATIILFYRNRSEFKYIFDFIKNKIFKVKMT